MQGYLFRRPVPAGEIAGTLARHPNSRQADEYLLTAQRGPFKTAGYFRSLERLAELCLVWGESRLRQSNI
jgi:hypothetical protein